MQQPLSPGVVALLCYQPDLEKRIPHQRNATHMISATSGGGRSSIGHLSAAQCPLLVELVQEAAHTLGCCEPFHPRWITI